MALRDATRRSMMVTTTTAASRPIRLLLLLLLLTTTMRESLALAPTITPSSFRIPRTTIRLTAKAPSQHYLQGLQDSTSSSSTSSKDLLLFTPDDPSISGGDNGGEHYFQVDNNQRGLHAVVAPHHHHPVASPDTTDDDDDELAVSSSSLYREEPVLDPNGLEFRVDQSVRVVNDDDDHHRAVIRAFHVLPQRPGGRRPFVPLPAGLVGTVVRVYHQPNLVSASLPILVRFELDTATATKDDDDNDDDDDDRLTKQPHWPIPLTDGDEPAL
mmetsp:Transcript_20941/g.57937  ORF Transcript_20941/g.57937 Transcript_20941/m.57937 type:complete len:271 (-) Transcript_20941:426-1238(-)